MPDALRRAKRAHAEAQKLDDVLPLTTYDDAAASDWSASQLKADAAGRPLFVSPSGRVSAAEAATTRAPETGTWRVSRR